MHSVHRLLSLLRCPECGGALRLERVVLDPQLDGASGVLACACSRYPLLDGVPILMRGRLDVREHVTGAVQVVGPPVETIVRLID
ncbi:MAG TPA: hypothetical protein VNN07_04815, partial [Candidatus Tectomicrobia bacterium]|nr:hypothetical protein [Candidatus Tectomicrobia bacterium]